MSISNSAPESVLVVPCYNEEKRFPLEAFKLFFAEAPEKFQVIFVNDGSTDQTLGLLKQLETEFPKQCEIYSLPQNSGKSEAVRAGILRAISKNAKFIGFADADLSTPPEEILRVLGALKDDEKIQVLIGSRILFLGSEIERNALRHYLSRVFATFASLILQIPVYDTQCGCKFFRNTESLQSVFEKPFPSRWAFDVELLSRFLENPQRELRLPLGQIKECPLRVWRNVGGSTLRLPGMIRAFLDLGALYLRLRKQRNKLG
jgi:dolichyl-phosphate beta-glucosyltransferase